LYVLPAGHGGVWGEDHAGGESSNSPLMDSFRRPRPVQILSEIELELPSLQSTGECSLVSSYADPGSAVVAPAGFPSDCRATYGVVKGKTTKRRTPRWVQLSTAKSSHCAAARNAVEHEFNLMLVRLVAVIGWGPLSSPRERPRSHSVPKTPSRSGPPLVPQFVAVGWNRRAPVTDYFRLLP